MHCLSINPYAKITLTYERRYYMIIRHFPVDITLGYPLAKKYNADKIAFFDIETTGFTANNTYLYLIGCIYTEGSSMHLIQWFAEDIREEADLIRNFFDFIKDYDILVHYNGSGFDIPYITKKCEMFQLKYSFDNIQNLDLYKIISPIKKIFGLKNHKQKSIEEFLNVKREDTLNGGDLIGVYQSYLGKKRIENLKKSRNLQSTEDVLIRESENLLHFLLLHNEDDLKGLVRICPILYYIDLFDREFQIVQASVNNGQFIVHLEYDFKLPSRISFGNECIFINAYQSSAIIYIKAYEGEMKHFYDNYRDYYYLPEEDRAVHKSLAIFVDKEYRKKATPATCYTKKQGVFVPQYHPVLNPYFKFKYDDKVTFVEVHTDFLFQEENLTRYINHILNYIINHI